LDPSLLNLEKGLRAKPGVRDEAGGLPRSPSRWELRRRERREALRLSAAAPGILPRPPERKTVGRFVGLTLLIDFSDEPATIGRDEVEAFCNQTGYNGFDNQGSVRDYFLDVSDRKLDYTNIVAPYYRAKQPRSYYTNETIAQPLRAVELIREALDALVDQGFDSSQVTSDSQDYVYALNIFYAGSVSNNWAKGLWPHAYHLETPYTLGRGKNIHDYQITDMGNELTLGTFCHENGHMICDFPDLYDYGYQSSGAGRGKNPTQVGAYLKHAAGWTSDAKVLTSGDSVTLQAGINDFAFYRKNDEEYFVIENRAASARDLELGDAGLAVWHVDELGSNNNEQGSPTSHYECALLQADGHRHLEAGVNDGDRGDLYRAGHNESLSSKSRPHSNWWDKSHSGLEIVKIGAAGPKMTFEVV
jgi:M6 family metalloprotease-like protein